jgi:signal transduction histidine kinase
MENARLLVDAREAIAVRDEFLSIAGHELRTPLTALKLRIEMLGEHARHGGPAEKISSHAERAQLEVNRLSSLVDELLDISRITAGRLVLERSGFSLLEAIREVLARFADEVVQSGCMLALDVAPGVGRVRGNWDRLRLEQVISNLISNALKYGRGKPVSVALRRVGSNVQLSVTDQGIGISAADQARIFERFERAVPSQHFGGFGLGLWICRQLVEAHGGSIQVESEPGRGARFLVELPLDAPRERSGADAPTPPG